MEKKTNDLSVHDVGLIFRLNQSGLAPAANGSAYTNLLLTLNNGCFAGSCDWRVPTLTELQTIQQEPCAGSPCIDAAFGPTYPARYWTSTDNLDQPTSGWTVNFQNGTLDSWNRASDYAVRAVRGGLQ